MKQVDGRARGGGHGPGLQYSLYFCFMCYHHQDKSYNFEEVPSLHESLLKFHFLDTDTLYDVSLQREPRWVWSLYLRTEVCNRGVGRR